ncbi:cytochrome c [Botrimarina sp.]|uniref:cytochrome c n=1 Tax=Botrimarina sp. TaxID=2795802 RepID=UPI0032EFF2A6
MRLLLAISACLTLSSPSAGAQPRARAPEFTDDDRAAFFGDAFDALVGERPEAAAALTQPPAAPSGGEAEAVDWAGIVATDVLETEIKRQAAALGDATRSATRFKAGGYRDAVDALSMLATLFAVVDEHGGSPRWRDAAAGLRELFAEAAAQAGAATDSAHEAASARQRNMADLIRGSRPAVPAPGRGPVDWSLLASRNTLMRRMEAAERGRLTPLMADDAAFRRGADEVRHEAQLLALLAQAILRPEAADHADPGYQRFARRLRQASTALAAAAEAEDRGAATRAMTEVSRSCVDCHADFRG